MAKNVVNILWKSKIQIAAVRDCALFPRLNLSNVTITALPL